MLAGRPGLAPALVVDTGPGADSGGGWSLYDDRPQTPGYQQLAARFTVGTIDTIGSVQGWMNWDGGRLVFSVMSDFQGLPGARLHSATGLLAPTATNVPDWRGIGQLDWTLQPGSYWLVFEDSRDPGSGSMPGGAPSPLSAYASGPGVVPGAPWMRADTLGFGLRINAGTVPPPPVPEPSTIWLRVCGGAALLLRRRVAARRVDHRLTGSARRRCCRRPPGRPAGRAGTSAGAGHWCRG
jgi:hypothetical protein